MNARVRSEQWFKENTPDVDTECLLCGELLNFEFLEKGNFYECKTNMELYKKEWLIFEGEEGYKIKDFLR